MALISSGASAVWPELLQWLDAQEQRALYCWAVLSRCLYLKMYIQLVMLVEGCVGEVVLSTQTCSAPPPHQSLPYTLPPEWSPPPPAATATLEG
jgi:hypothetical protein